METFFASTLLTFYLYTRLLKPSSGRIENINNFHGIPTLNPVLRAPANCFLTKRFLNETVPNLLPNKCLAPQLTGSFLQHSFLIEVFLHELELETNANKTQLLE